MIESGIIRDCLLAEIGAPSENTNQGLHHLRRARHRLQRHQWAQKAPRGQQDVYKEPSR